MLRPRLAGGRAERRGADGLCPQPTAPACEARHREAGEDPRGDGSGGPLKRLLSGRGPFQCHPPSPPREPEVSETQSRRAAVLEGCGRGAHLVTLGMVSSRLHGGSACARSSIPPKAPTPANAVPRALWARHPDPWRPLSQQTLTSCPRPVAGALLPCRSGPGVFQATQGGTPVTMHRPPRPVWQDRLVPRGDSSSAGLGARLHTVTSSLGNQLGGETNGRDKATARRGAAWGPRHSVQPPASGAEPPAPRREDH